MRSTCAALVLLISACAAVVPPALAAGRPDVLWMAGGHSGDVAGVAYSPDGAFLASGSADGTVKLWRLSDGRLLSSYGIGGNCDFAGVQFTPDGNLLACGLGGAILLSSADTTGLVSYIAGELGSNAALSPDGAVLAVAGAFTGFEEDVDFFNTSDGTLLSTVGIQHIGATTDVLYTPDGTSVIASGTSGIYYWRVSDGQQLRHLTAHNGTVNALAMRADRQVFASGGADHTIKLWNVADGTVIRTLTGHTNEVTDVAFSPDSLQFASAGRDGTIRIWNVATGSLIRTITGHVGPVLSVAWSPSGTELASGGVDMTLRRWNPATGAPLGTVTQVTDRLDSLTVSHAGTLAAGGYAGAVDIRSQSDGALLRRITNTTLVLNVAMADDGVRVAASDTDLKVKLWDTATGVLEHTLTGHNTTPFGLTMTPDGSKVLACDFDGLVRVNDAASGALIRTLPFGSNLLSISADGQRVAGYSLTLAGVWQIDTAALVRSVSSGSEITDTIALSPDGQTLAVSTTDLKVRLWRVSDGALLRTLSGFDDIVNVLAFSSDGRVLASAAGPNDHNLRLWRVADGHPLAAFDAELGAGIAALRYAADDRRIFYSRIDATVLAMTNPFIIGDINADSTVDAADVQTMVDILLGAPTPPDQLLRADLNASGTVDGADIQDFVDAALSP